MFEIPCDLGGHIQYSADHNLDEDSWFGIEGFSKKDYCLDFLKNTFNSAEYDILDNLDVDKLDFLCSYQNNNEYCFRKITNSKLIKKKIIHLGDAFKYEEKGKIITINTIPDAIYLKDKDILYFKRLQCISSIFKGIDVLYRRGNTSRDN